MTGPSSCLPGRRHRPRGDRRRPCACSSALPRRVEIERHLFGGAAIDACGDPLPADDARCVRAAPTRCCSARSAGPKWDGGARPARGRA